MHFKKLLLFPYIALGCSFMFGANALGQSNNFVEECPASPVFYPASSFASFPGYPTINTLNSPYTHLNSGHKFINPDGFELWETGFTTPFLGLYGNSYLSSNRIEFPIHPLLGAVANTGKIWMYLAEFNIDAINIEVFNANNVSIPFTTVNAYPALPAWRLFNVYIEANEPITAIEYTFPGNETLLIEVCAY